MSKQATEGNHLSIYEKHEGAILSGAAFLIFMLVAAVIAINVSVELEKDRSKDVDAQQLLWQPKINKVDAIELYGTQTRTWVRSINEKNVKQLQMINDLKTRLATLEEQTKCLRK